MVKFASVTICLSLPALASAFTSVSTTCTKSSRVNELHMNKNVVPEPATKNGSGNILETIFTGGAFEDDFSKEEILSSATVIASKIKSTKDLGWKIDPPKRKGKARPRHRAWGGEGEMPVQDKANYKEENERCVEKWLTMEDFLANTKSKPGPAADTVFVALAGGAKYAERDICLAKIEQWASTPSNASKTPAKPSGVFGRRAGGASTFNEKAFIKSVQDGRRDLFLGWAGFLSVNTFFAGCIIFPTNPGAKFLATLVDSLKDQVV